MSDARVSFVRQDTGEIADTWDGVQKIHEIVPNVLMGFAGSIEFGSKCMSDFRNFVGPNPTRKFLDLPLALDDWSKGLRDAWGDPSKGGPADATTPCHLMFLYVHPTETVGDVAWWPATYGFIVRAPTFDIEGMPAWKLTSIGSGGGVPAYVQVLDDWTDRWTEIANIARAPVAGLTRLFVAGVLHGAISRTRETTVSECLHMGEVSRHGGVDIESIKVTALVPSARSVAMPRVARSWEEYQRIAPALPSGAQAIA